MKYIFKAMVRTRAIWLAILGVMLSVIHITLNAKILMWIAAAIDSGDMHEVNLVVVGCIITTILEVGIDGSGMSRHLIYKEMQNMLSDKLLRADIALFSKFSPGVVSHTINRVWQMTSLLSMSLAILRSAVEIVTNVVAIILLSRNCALPVIIAFIIGSICTYILSTFFNKIDEEIDNIKARRSAELDEIINGFTEVRSFSGTAERHREFITELNNGSVKTFLKRQMLYSVTGVALEASTQAATIIILLYIIASKDAGIGAMGLSIVMYAWRLEGPFLYILSQISDF